MRRQQFQNTTIVMLGIIIVLLITISPAVKQALTDLMDDATLGTLWLSHFLSEPFEWLVRISLFALAGLATYACAVAPWKDDMKGAAATAALWTFFIGSTLGFMVGFYTGSAVLGWAVVLSGAVYTVIVRLVIKYRRFVRSAQT